MKIIIFISVLVFFNFFNQLKADIINNIIVNNNERISLGTIKTYGKIEIGKDYSDDDLNQVLKNLYETKFFKNISLKIDNQVLIIDLIENKLVQTIIIEGIKSSTIKNTILESLIIKEKAPFNESDISKDLSNVKRSLTSEGK